MHFLAFFGLKRPFLGKPDNLYINQTHFHGGSISESLAKEKLKFGEFETMTFHQFSILKLKTFFCNFIPMKIKLK